MEGITSSQLERWSNGRWFRGLTPAHIGEFTMDTRDLRAGDVFVALRTGKRDGHDFVRQAASAGATAVIAERPDLSASVSQLIVDDTLEALHRIAAGVRKEFKGTLVGVTGSCGKTSTKDLLALLLGEGVMSTRGNFNNYIGMPLTLTRLCSDALKTAVVEVGISQKGEMAPLAQMVAPDYGVVTCVAPAHLSGLGDLAGVAEEKAGLLAPLTRDKRAFFPAYCLQWAPFCELRARCFVTANMDEETPVMPAPNYNLIRYQTFHSATASRSDMLVFMPGTEHFARFPLPRISGGMQSNAALALAVALEMGIPEEVLRERIQGWKPANMRGEIRHIGNVDYYVDCYNANPASMLDAVQNFRDFFPGVKRLFMFGCMNELGNDAQTLHTQLGERIGTDGEEIFCIVGPNGDAIRDGLLKAGARESGVIVAKERADAHAVLSDFQKGSGAVFIKGSRSYQMEEFLPEQDSKKGSH